MNPIPSLGRVKPDPSLLIDVEETVVAKVLASLTNLCELRLLQKMRIWELMSATLGFLYHPNIWIRQGGSHTCPGHISRLLTTTCMDLQVLRHSSHRLRNICLRATCGVSCIPR